MAKPQYAGFFPHKIKGDHPNKSCVYLIRCGDGYFIWKCQSFLNSVHHTTGDMERWHRSWIKDGHAFSKLMNFILENNIREVEFDPVLFSENPVDLLLKEKSLLMESRHDIKCLNIVFEPHIPGWISDNDREIFNHKNTANETRNE